MKLLLTILILSLYSCELINEYDDSEKLTINVLSIDKCELEVLGVKIYNDTTFVLPVIDISSSSIKGSATNATISIHSSNGSDNFRIAIKGSFSMIYYRKK